MTLLDFENARAQALQRSGLMRFAGQQDRKFTAPKSGALRDGWQGLTSAEVVVLVERNLATLGRELANGQHLCSLTALGVRTRDEMFTNAEGARI